MHTIRIMTLADFGTQSPLRRNGEPWIMTVPAVSTTHIQQSDVVKLDNMSWPMMGDLETGWLLRLGPDVDAGFKDCSQAMRELLNAFRARGFEYLRLDADGEKLSDMRTFNW